MNPTRTIAAAVLIAAPYVATSAPASAATPTRCFTQPAVSKDRVAECWSPVLRAADCPAWRGREATVLGILWRESRAYIYAANPRSSARGAYQVLRSSYGTAAAETQVACRLATQAKSYRWDPLRPWYPLPAPIPMRPPTSSPTMSTPAQPPSTAPTVPVTTTSAPCWRCGAVRGTVRS